MLNENMNKLSEMETDVIGEVMNISMGAAATALSTILDRKVSITTPRIDTIKVEDFEFPNLEPAMGVLIKYVDGIEGSNIMVLKQDDLKNILRHLLSMEPADEIEFDEISVSAICEIMNQMMGSAAGALATFFGKTVNISPPEILNIDNPDMVRNMFSLSGEYVASIKFHLSIDGLVESEFISAMEPSLAKALVSTSLGVNDLEEPQEVPIIEEIQPPPVTQKAQPVVEQPRPPKTHEPQAQVNATPYQYKKLNDAFTNSGLDASENNLDLIMSVPIQLTVELGRARKKIKDIVDLTQGNIVELDKQAGDQVDVLANGRLIARGDVVVVDDNYSVRITSIVKLKENISEIANK